eukprot:gnl/Hemi2/8115_TR2791_c0_g1_i1.p1 gnl/Hemi2/8115_TR2791_c0_g1~~gnl/Hemi2/8115_TR2791_c0_g1_i1.p1  ORF type:complete len:276 (-),score=83.97 gnl/Hemi2/8115_TR2791_c0_g1_i1:127-954(-)
MDAPETRYNSSEAFPDISRAIFFWLNCGTIAYGAVYGILGLVVLFFTPACELYWDTYSLGLAMYIFLGVLQFCSVEFGDTEAGGGQQNIHSALLTKKLLFCIINEITRVLTIAVCRHDFWLERIDYVNSVYSLAYGSVLPIYIAQVLIGYLLAFAFRVPSSNSQPQFLETYQERWGRVLVEAHIKTFVMVLYHFTAAIMDAMTQIGLYLLVAKFYPFFFIGSMGLAIVNTTIEHILIDKQMVWAAMGVELAVGLSTYLTALFVWGLYGNKHVPNF